MSSRRTEDKTVTGRWESSRTAAKGVDAVDSNFPNLPKAHRNAIFYDIRRAEARRGGSN